MKTKFLFLMLLLFCYSCIAEKEQDVAVRLLGEPDVTMSEAQKKRNQVLRSVRLHLPYKTENDDGVFELYSTLGCLCRLSDEIVIANIISVTSTVSIVNGDANPMGEMLLEIEKTLLGCSLRDTLLVKTHWYVGSIREYAKGDRVMVFLSNVDYFRSSKNLFKIIKWNFDKSKLDAQRGDHFLVVGQRRGCIKLNTMKDEAKLIAAVKKYVNINNEKQQDAEAYYEVIRDLVTSSNLRIREDARCDLLSLIRSHTPSVLDLNKVVNDEKVDDGIKEYLRLYWIPYVEEYRKNL